jgi:multiple sugar transport system permease protein
LLTFLAALYAVPETLYEAAKIDGAGSWALFTGITLPLIRPALLFVLVTQFVSHLQVFGQAYVMTDGGPGYASYTAILHIYRNAWRYYHMGYAGAMALVLAAVMLVFALIQFRLLGQRVEY